VERRRSREDRRLQLVSITDAGRQVVDEVDHMAADLGTEYRRGITRSERLQLVSILQRLRANLRRMDATGESSDLAWGIGRPSCVFTRRPSSGSYLEPLGSPRGADLVTRDHERFGSVE
jgi:hypothetical protein